MRVCVCVCETVCIHWEAARSSTASEAAAFQDNWCATFKPYTRIWCYNTIVVAFWIAFLVHFRVYKSPDKICIVETCSKWVLENQKPIHFVQKGKRYLVLKCISLKPFDFGLLGITSILWRGGCVLKFSKIVLSSIIFIKIFNSHWAFLISYHWLFLLKNPSLSLQNSIILNISTSSVHCSPVNSVYVYKYYVYI